MKNVFFCEFCLDGGVVEDEGVKPKTFCVQP